MVNEASYLPTGYGVYGKELLLRLYSAGYEVAELACYGHPNDPRAQGCPWKIYRGMPDVGPNGQPINEKEAQEYGSNPSNAWGKMYFDSVALDFKPDVVIDIRDKWMCDFIANSPYKHCFKFLHMPTVDSEPQPEEFIDMYARCDGLLTYSQFGFDLLKKQNRNLPLIDVGWCGVDHNVFKPVQNKAEHRKMLGLSPDLFIIGTVMRNQKRKLYPELMESFVEFLRRVPKDLADRSVLYFHTSYPDIGWDFPYLIKKYNLGHKVLFTYLCDNSMGGCGKVFCDIFNDAINNCKHCGKPTAITPGSNKGVDRETLAAIYNLFDVYVQYTCSEGFGIPIIEASACGLPVFATNYSAPESIIKEISAIPINIGKKYLEAETGYNRVYPDNNDFVDKLYRYCCMSDVAKKKMSDITREKTVEKFNWDRISKIWIKAIEKVGVGNWTQEPQILQPNTNIPNGLSNVAFVEWCFINILYKPEWIGSYMFLRACKDLNLGKTRPTMGSYIFSDHSLAFHAPDNRPFTRQDLVNELIGVRNNINHWEQIRANSLHR